MARWERYKDDQPNESFRSANRRRVSNDSRQMGTGDHRLLSASEHRIDASIAARFGVSTGTVWKLRQQVNGKPIPPKGTQEAARQLAESVALSINTRADRAQSGRRLLARARVTAAQLER